MEDVRAHVQQISRKFDFYQRNTEHYAGRLFIYFSLQYIIDRFINASHVLLS